MLASGSLRAEIPVKDVAPPKYEIEPGASLRVLRPSKFVAGDETMYLENAKKFTDATGVDVKVDFESWEDLRPKIAVAATVGDGPDIALAWSDEPHKYADKILPLDDLATYLGEKYGGWWPIAQRYGTLGGRWIAMPIGASGGRVVYRKSWVGEAGYDDIPTDVDKFLDLCGKLQANGHPAGLALGNAVGDGNAWCQWVMWAFGGALTDENDKVIINSKETVEALKYAKALHATFIPGTLSWLDPSNNKAFLSGETRADPERHLGLLRRQELGGCRGQGDGRGHLSRAHADRPGRQADRTGADPQPDGLQLYQVPERGQGVPPLHHGARAVRPVPERLHRLLEPPVAGLRRQRRLDRRPEARAVQGRDQDRAVGRLQGQSRRGFGVGAGRLRRRPDGGLGLRRPGHARGGGGGSRAARERYYKS